MLFSASSRERYLSSFRNELDYWAVWEPGNEIELWEFGTIGDGQFISLGNIWDEFLTRYDADKEKISSDLKLVLGSATISDVQATVNAGGLASFSLGFSNRDSLFLRAHNSSYCSIPNLYNLAKRIQKIGEWKSSKWYLVSGVRSAERFTVLTANEDGGSIEVNASLSDLQALRDGIADADASINFSGSVGLSYVGGSGPIHIDLVQINKHGVSPKSFKGHLQENKQDMGDAPYKHIGPKEVFTD